jgi:SAM-dependent methyltransferase
MNYGASKHYQAEGGESYFAYQRTFAEGAELEARKFAPHVRPSDRVIDFGCGGGWVLAQLECAERVGVELNDAAHGFCQKNGVRVYRTLAEVEGSGFDIGISNHCLEHVPCPVEALRGVRSLLRPGGILVLVVPLDDWRVQRDYTGKDIDHHLHTWTPRLLANTLVESGYVVNRVEVLTYAWFPGWRNALRVLPGPLFNWLCWLTAVIKRRRQLLAIAVKSSQ